MPHPSHRPGARNPKLTEGELRAVLHALDIVNTTPADAITGPGGRLVLVSDRPKYRPEFEEHEWRALQRGAAKLTGALPPRSSR